MLESFRGWDGAATRYVGMVDEEIPEPSFFDELDGPIVGHTGATQVAETSRDDEESDVAGIAV